MKTSRNRLAIAAAMSMILMAPTDGEASTNAGAATTAIPPAPAKAPTKAEVKAAAAVEKATAKAKEKADKEAAAKTAAAAKTEKVEQNGVTRPASGKTKLVWDIADAMSKELKAPVSRKAITDALIAAPHLLVIGTIHTQYGKWRKFHGLVKEVAAPAPAEVAVETGAETAAE